MASDAESTQAGARRRAAGDGRVGLALGAALLAMALVAGLCFTFMAAVMPNLAGVDDHTFVTVLARFDAQPVFGLGFTAALALTVLAAVLHARRAGGPAGRWLAVALGLYAAALAITGAIHLPLNDQLSGAGDPAAIADLAGLRREFETPWVIGNVVRTACCVAAVAALARAIHLHGRTSAHAHGAASARA